MTSRNSVWRPALITVAALLVVSSLRAQDSVDGDWEGAIIAQGQEIGITVHLSSADGALGGTIDVPMQGASGLPLHEVRFAAPGIHFEMLPGPSLATFDGTVHADSIGGTFTQAGVSGTFWLTPSQPAAEETEPE
jgi:hypothetical protein